MFAVTRSHHWLPLLLSFTRKSPLAAVMLFGWMLTVTTAVAETSPIDPDGVPGALMVAGGGRLPDRILDRFVELAGGGEAKLVIIPTASNAADQPEAEQKTLASWREREVKSVTMLHTRDRAKADSEDFTAALNEATGVWFGGGQQSRIAESYVGTLVERKLQKLLERGGVIGGTSAGGAIQTKRMIAGGNPEAVVKQGLDLLPDAVVDQHYLKRNRQPRLRSVIQASEGLVGFGVDEATAMLVRGRRIQVLGDSSVTVVLPASQDRERLELTLSEGAVGDLTALRRAARQRAAKEPFPRVERQVPKVENGSLVIVGGGGLPSEIVERFIELAGGPDALIVVLPTAAPDPLPIDARFTSGFRKYGARNVKVLRQRSRSEVEGAAFREAMNKAGGVWFGGGRQWRFVDAYAGTAAVALMRDVLRRGGVIGGSSAGASIQAEYLVRGNPLGNQDMMAEGYEQGFGFLPGAAVDQHFAQRRRFRDMSAVADRFPQLLGIGIDEATALVVQKNIGEVIGKHAVHFYDRRRPVEAGQPDYLTVEAGQRFDFQNRELLKED